MFELKSTYLNTAYMGPLPLQAKTAIEQMAVKCLDPSQISFEERMNSLEDLRKSFAGLLNVPHDNVAFSSSCAELVGHIANGLTLEPGDDVILLEGDYPSMILPWMLASERRGFKLVRLPLEKFLDPASLKKEITPRTRLIGCSHVMFNTGLRLPIEELGRVAREHDALFMADTSQSFGGMPIGKEVLANVDILVGVAYKWLLGPYGSAYGYFTERTLQRVQRTHASWTASVNSSNTENLLNYTLETLPGARKFDRGEPGTYLIVAGLQSALDLIREKGLENIHRHNSGLVKHFLDHLPKNFTTLAATDRISHIVCIKPEAEDVQALKIRLLKSNIQVSVREGSVRLSFHFFNTQKDVELILTELGR